MHCVILKHSVTHGTSIPRVNIYYRNLTHTEFGTFALRSTDKNLCGFFSLELFKFFELANNGRLVLYSNFTRSTIFRLFRV